MKAGCLMVEIRWRIEVLAVCVIDRSNPCSFASVARVIMYCMLMQTVLSSYPVVGGDEIMLVNVLGGDVLSPLKLLIVLQFDDGELCLYCRVQIIIEPKRLKVFNHITDYCKELHLRIPSMI